MQTDKQTDRQTRPKKDTTPLRGWSKINQFTVYMLIVFANKLKFVF